jgi:hypothetical protein
MKFRFTIRDLLGLNVVVALATGWWINCRQLNLELQLQRQKVDELERLNRLLDPPRRTGKVRPAPGPPPAEAPSTKSDAPSATF